MQVIIPGIELDASDTQNYNKKKSNVVVVCKLYKYIYLFFIWMNNNYRSRYFKKNQICNNCKTQGHFFNQCKLPIVSFGIILFRFSTTNIPEYLMIRRRDSFAFAAFMRGKYEVQNIEFIQNLIDEMSVSEKRRIDIYSFEDLWMQMCGGPVSKHKMEEHGAYRKFHILKDGVQIGGNDITINLSQMIEKSLSRWEETEWEFPKGRSNKNESEIDCAVREFEEETGYNRKYITLVGNILPYEETFIGSNHTAYRHKYFLAHTQNIGSFKGKYQQSEVSMVQWKTYEECIESIRSHQTIKKELITRIHSMINEYQFFE